MNLVPGILNRNTSAWQTIVYALANAAGLAIVMAALQLYCDFTRGQAGGTDSFVPDDYIIVSRPVSALSALAGRPATFSPADIADIAAQPWAADVGAFEAADCDVFATIDFGGARMSTSLFLEAIPDDFVDTKPAGWDWHAGQKELPIIVGRDYLALYNFGYAPARGLPQLSESMVGAVPLHLIMRSRDGRMQEYTARIAGFSSRLNTIAVPQAFMDHVNSTIGPASAPQSPSRLIIRLRQAGDPAAAEWIDAHRLEIAGNRLDVGRLAHVLAVAVTIVVTIGLVITLLALGIMVLSIFLLLRKNKARIDRLLLLGYSAAQLRRVYARRVALLNGGVLIAAFVIVACASQAWTPVLEKAGIGQGPVWPAIVAGCALALITTATGLLAVARTVMPR